MRIVIRIQIQITKKKISKATRRSSPKLMSANGNKVIPFGRIELRVTRVSRSQNLIAMQLQNSATATEVARLRLETPARIGIAMRASARSSSSPLMPWRSVPKASTARGGQPPGRSSSPSGSIASSGRSLSGSASTAATGSAKCRPAAPRTASGIPGVVLAGGQDRGRVGRGGDPDAGADVAHVLRLLEQDDRGRARVGEHGGEVDRRAAGDRDDAGARHQRHQLGQVCGVDPLHPAAPAARPGRAPAPPPAPPAPPGRPRPPRPARRRSAARA